MLDEITPQQFDEWIAFMQIEPQGEERDDLRMIQICLAVNRSMGGDATAEDFSFDFYGQDDLDESGEESEEALKEQAQEEAEILKRLAGWRPS